MSSESVAMLIVCIALAVVGAVALIGSESECASRGGVLVGDAWGFGVQCVKPAGGTP